MKDDDEIRSRMEKSLEVHGPTEALKASGCSSIQAATFDDYHHQAQRDGTWADDFVFAATARLFRLSLL